MKYSLLYNDVNSETIWLNQSKCANVIPNQTWFLFWTFFYFPQITLSKYLWEGLVITAFQRWHLYLSQKPTQELETVLFGALMPILCVQNSVTAKMLCSVSLGRSGSQLFVTTKWRYRAMRRKRMTNKPIYGIWKFLILNFSHFPGPTF